MFECRLISLPENPQAQKHSVKVQENFDITLVLKETTRIAHILRNNERNTTFPSTGNKMVNIIIGKLVLNAIIFQRN